MSFDFWLIEYETLRIIFEEKKTKCHDSNNHQISRSNSVPGVVLHIMSIIIHISLVQLDQSLFFLFYMKGNNHRMINIAQLLNGKTIFLCLNGLIP